MWGEELEANLDRYDRPHPGRFATFAQWDRRWFEARATRELIVAHADRIVFGTDAFPPDRDVYAIHRRFCETADEAFDDDPEPPAGQGRWTISGLELPADVIAKVYSGNALRVASPS